MTAKCSKRIPTVRLSSGAVWSLYDDVARCLDATCPQREACDRWLQRESGWVSQQTFRKETV